MKATSRSCYAFLGFLVVVFAGCAWLYRQVFPDCNAPLENPSLEVIISGCRNPHLRSTSPDGTYMVYGTEERHGGLWLRNLITGEEQRLSAASDYWISSELLLQETKHEGVREFQISNVKTRSQTPLRSILAIPDATSRLDNGTLVFSPEVLSWFQQAETVYYAPDSLSIAIALAGDFKSRPQENYVLATSANYPRDSDAIAKFLTENKIQYTEIHRGFDSEHPLPSHDGRFVAVGSRITTPGGEMLVQTTEYIEPIAGWASDDSGVYFQPAGVSNAPILFPLFRPGIAQPILKLRLPPEYLTPTARQTQEARQYQENQVRMSPVIGISILLLLLIVGTWLLWRQKNVNRETLQ